ncbi:rhomboid family intramembrane serine protease [Mucisphaera calidilacus]|uniref:Rhomboid family protein n=1 Tax=Mucisphaera calidilacus TaxID=2527982 RepID=A0A518C0K4_9BACT|nr:rhomboid family intramembrane serine protease [Mucisphaera calidilacus]QDU72762.1 Rhomboid family protein [Mucisphaera calidilacus]
MLLPLKTDRPQRRTPVVNYTLIGLSVLAFLLTGTQLQQAVDTEPYRFVAQFFLWPESARLSQFITYQFLHADWLHLTGNMVFLYVFGNLVEDRLGKIAYLFFYLSGGVIAGLGHTLTDTAPVLGASGSVAAVTGAYLALFPQSTVTILYILVIIGTFEVSGMALILFRVAQDILFQLNGIGEVAYMAHIAGYFYGFVISMALLMTRLLKREPYDMLALIAQKRRRSEFRKLARSGYQPWEAQKTETKDTQQPLSEQQQRAQTIRENIASAMSRGDLHQAALRYTDLLTVDEKQTLAIDAQLDVANQLMSDQRHDAAARAYENFLTAYNTYHDRAQVQLLLGLLYARYLSQPQRAKELLAAAEPRLKGDEQTLAQRTLKDLD